MANTLRFKRGLLAGLPSAAVGEPLFTTDTFDLYIGTASGTQKYQKFIASGTTSQLLRGDGSLLTMPIVLTSPSNGQVLKYNGTSWVNDSDSGITGSGTTNYLPKFTGATTLGNSLVTDNGTRLQINNNNASILRLGTDTGGYYVLQDFYVASQRNGFIQAFDNGTSRFFDIWASANISLRLGSNDTERARITSGGNFIINNASTDNGLRFQVTGDGFFSGSVGIGVSSPISKLHISNSTSDGLVVQTTTNAEPFIAIQRNVSASNGVAVLRLLDGGSIAFDNGATGAAQSTKMTLNASGNLGLGVTPSAWSVKAIQIAAGSLTGGNSGQGLALVRNGFFDGSWKYVSSSTASIYEQDSGEHRWSTAPSGTAGNAITFTQAMTLDASGRLIVNHTNTAKGNIDVAADNNAVPLVLRGRSLDGEGQLEFWNYAGSVRYGTLGSTSNYSYFGSIANTPLFFSTNSTERMRIFADGNVGIGTGSTNVGYKLDVSGTIRANGGQVLVIGVPNNWLQSTQSGTSAQFQTWYASNGSTRRGYFGYPNGGADNFTLMNEANGQLVIGTNSISALTIDSTGAATFSSSVTAGGNLLLTNGTASSVGAINLIRTGASPVASRLTFGTDGTGYSFAIGKNQGGTVTDLLTILDSGAATFSSTISSTGTNGFAIGNLTNTQRIQYGSDVATSFTLLTAANAYAGLYAGAVVLSGNLTVDTNTLFVDAANNRVGVKQSSPTSSLHVDGSNARSYVTKTANYTMTENDYTVLCDTTSGGFTITLPAASGCAGRIYCIKKTIGNSGVNNVTIDGNASETIDGSTTISLQCRSSVIIQSDGSNWWVLAEKNDASCI